MLLKRRRAAQGNRVYAAAPARYTGGTDTP
jgi:hypothetical protein